MGNTNYFNHFHRESVIEAMRNNILKQDEPCVGSFWYDIINNELYGVVSVTASDLQYYKSSTFNDYIKTSSRLHSDIWRQKERQGRDKRFTGDYTLKPRGRVFQFKKEGFIVCVGSWIRDYPEAKEIIIDEFQLPEDTQFVIDKHWEIGHGWSEEDI